MEDDHPSERELTLLTTATVMLPDELLEITPLNEPIESTLASISVVE
jgi:hypothetical protein|tara:strand:+ start:925 stop:1065 length:141 start_codon:yes stop_codon:yes gene_type:complete